MFNPQSTPLELRCLKCERPLSLTLRGQYVLVGCGRCLTQLSDLEGGVGMMRELAERYGEAADAVDGGPEGG